MQSGEPTGLPLKDLFRREASEALSSPEQLDVLIRITRPLDWVALGFTLLILVGAVVWSVRGQVPQFVQTTGVLTWDRPPHPVRSLASGQVVEVAVRTGDVVKRGQVVAFLQGADVWPQMSRIEVVAGHSGRVGHIQVEPGDVIGAGTTLMMLAPVDARLAVVSFVPVVTGKRIRPGMAVQVTPTTVDRDTWGYLLGTVQRTTDFVVTQAEIEERLGSAELARLVASKGAAFLLMEVRLQEDPSTKTGFAWSSPTGPPFRLTPDTVCQVQLVTHALRPIELVMPALLKNLGGDPEAQ